MAAGLPSPDSHEGRLAMVRRSCKPDPAGVEAAEIFGRDFEMRGPSWSLHEQVDEFAALLELSRDSERLTAELEETIGRMDRARAYVSDPASDPRLSSILVRSLSRRRERLERQLRSIRVHATQVFSPEPLAARAAGTHWVNN
jgi:hypothetical protein